MKQVASRRNSRIFIAVHFGEDPGQDNYCHRWEQSLLAAKVGVRRVNLLGAHWLAQLEDCDGVMWHWYHNARDKRAAPIILATIESVLQIPVFPDYISRWHFDEKLAQHYVFQAVAAPCVRTWVFWDRSMALEFLSDATYPLVLKLSAGAGASGVQLLRNHRQAVRMAKRLFQEGLFPGELELRGGREDTRTGFKHVFDRAYWSARYLLLNRHPPRPMDSEVQRGYVYLQEFLPGNDHDIRITVIGNRAFGYIRKNRAGDFRASGSGNFDVDPHSIPEQALEIAHSISRRLGFQCMAYDFLRDKKGQLRVNEISYGFLSWMVHRCSGYWDSEMKWHPGSRWPEDVQVEDFLACLGATDRE